MQKKFIADHRKLYRGVYQRVAAVLIARGEKITARGVASRVKRESHPDTSEIYTDTLELMIKEKQRKENRKAEINRRIKQAIA